MSCILSFIFALICAYVCAKIAKACNTNVVVACILGALFNVLAILGYGIFMYGINSKK